MIIFTTTLLKSIDNISFIFRFLKIFSGTRVRILQEKHGLNQQFIVYSHNILTSYPKETMKRLSELCNIKYTEDLLRPTIGNKNWLGNSHYGPTKGISNKISANYPKVLTKNDKLELLSKTKT